VVGGYFAVNWIDLCQGSLMLFALILIPVMAYGDFGGAENLVATIQDNYPEKMKAFGSIMTIAFLSSAVWGLGYFGQPHILVRFMSSRDNRSVKIGRRICISWMVIALAGAVLVGFFGIGYFPEGTLKDSELVLPEITERLLNPWLAAVIFAAIISAIMSTVAAVLLASGSSVVNDFYRRILRPKASQTELVWMGRLCVLSIAAVAVYMASANNPSVFKLVSHAWGGLGAAFGPVVIVSLFSRNMSKYSALWGMVFGGGTALVWIICHHYNLANIFHLYELAPGFVMGFVGVALGYRIGKPNEKAQQQFDEMEIKIKQ